MSGILKADGFDDALIGTARQFDREFLVYDRAKCVAILASQGMSHEDAEEYFEFNVQGAWVGEGTPAFLQRVDA